MNISTTVNDIIKEAVVETSVPQPEINAAKKLAAVCKIKLEGLLSEVNVAMGDLKGENEPSVLSSQDSFRTLFNRLKEIKRLLK